jgi:hypothetical protein
MLGSFVGTPEFIHASLAKYYDDLEAEAERLKELSNLQERMILFRSSFILKPQHIFRTIPPEITAPFARKIDTLNKAIVCSLTGHNNIQDMSDLVYASMKFPVDKGGIGINDPMELSTSAFVASIIDFKKEKGNANAYSTIC